MVSESAHLLQKLNYHESLYKCNLLHHMVNLIHLHPTSLLQHKSLSHLPLLLMLQLIVVPRICLCTGIKAISASYPFNKTASNSPPTQINVSEHP